MRPKQTEKALTDTDVRRDQTKVCGLQDIEFTDKPQVESQKSLGSYFSSFVVEEPRNLLVALSGLSILTAVFATVLPITIHFLNEYNVVQPPFAFMMVIVQTLLLPPLVCFSFATATIMFWYGSVTIRFVLAILTVLPGCFVFYQCLLS